MQYNKLTVMYVAEKIGFRSASIYYPRYLSHFPTANRFSNVSENADTLEILPIPEKLRIANPKSRFETENTEKSTSR